MLEAISAIVPVFVCIVLGVVLRRTGFLADGFWQPAERLTYYVLFPALLVSNLATADFGGVPALELAGVLVAVTLGAAAGMALLRPLLPWISGPAFSSIMQGTIRPNTFIGLAAAAVMWGSQGMALMAVGLAALVPVVNLLSVLALLFYAAPRRPTLRELLKPLASNPLILSCLVGLALNAAGIPLPLGIGPTLKSLGTASLPIGLLAVGAGLNLKALRGSGSPVLLSGLFKLLLLPAMAAAATSALGMPAVVVAVATLYSAQPCSPSSYVLARQMGGDAEVAASIITAQTLLAALTIPAVLYLVG